jgi:hypothetical protein
MPSPRAMTEMAKIALGLALLAMCLKAGTSNA